VRGFHTLAHLGNARFSVSPDGHSLFGNASWLAAFLQMASSGGSQQLNLFRRQLIDCEDRSLLILGLSPI